MRSFLLHHSLARSSQCSLCLDFHPPIMPFAISQSVVTRHHHRRGLRCEMVGSNPPSQLASSLGPFVEPDSASVLPLAFPVHAMHSFYSPRFFMLVLPWLVYGTIHEHSRILTFPLKDRYFSILGRGGHTTSFSKPGGRKVSRDGNVATPSTCF